MIHQIFAHAKWTFWILLALLLVVPITCLAIAFPEGMLAGLDIFSALADLIACLIGDFPGGKGSQGKGR